MRPYAALALLYASLFKLELCDCVPFSAFSLIVWDTLSQIVTDACTSLTSAEGAILQLRLPFARPRPALRLPQHPDRRT